MSATRVTDKSKSYDGRFTGNFTGTSSSYTLIPLQLKRLSDGVMVAQSSLEALVMVRIHVGQPRQFLFRIKFKPGHRQFFYNRLHQIGVGCGTSMITRWAGLALV